IASAITGCVIPLSRSNTIWIRWRCSGCPFQRSAVFKRRICSCVHLTTCCPESVRWSERITPRLSNAIHSDARCRDTAGLRFNALWKRYQITVDRQVQDDLAKWEMTPAGDPESQADNRSRAIEFAKIFKVSTPLVLP